ncbi:LOW QUALITY PROTEIN: Peptidase family M50 [Galbibacter orientalis DSM 19592]|uniref:Peptidase family M50 n=2 Tax=Galbibacter TaxID=379068 RepID=I3C7U0_9FLAO|nr:LOW QUALITY PROTEIN: Peptidase family M50 [Galbibacter orientalis DSM 19592]
MFVASFIIGVMTHEYGHYVMAKFLGYNPKFHFSYVSYDTTEFHKEFENIYEQYKDEIIEGADFPLKERRIELMRKLNKERFLIVSSGVFTTAMIGTLGFLVVLFFKSKPYTVIFFLFKPFLAKNAFFNLCLSIMLYGLGVTNFIYGGDELKLSISSEVSLGVFPIVLGVLGGIISCMSFLIFIKKSNRVLFIASGVLGGGIGAIVWFLLFGNVSFL